MSYDLAVWEGDRPADDAAAGKHYREHLVPQLEVCDPANQVPPTPRIKAYVEALLARWPDIDQDEDSPWSASPLMGAATGSFVYFPMVYSMADEASSFAAELAQQHGLVCYDPQLQRLRPLRLASGPGKMVAAPVLALRSSIQARHGQTEPTAGLPHRSAVI